jgi:uncharacterized membrane protein YdjX (TVP38/TMEM64 family)
MGDGPPKRRILATLLVVVALVLGGLPVVFGLGGFDRETVIAQARSWGTLGPVVLMALLVLQAVVAPLPAPPLLMAAGFVYGPVTGFGIGWLGLLLGASACFGAARLLGRPVAERFVRAERLAAIDEHVRKQSGTTFLTILSLRVFMPPFFDAVSYGCGLVAGLPLRWFLLATALGEVPKVASFTYLGAAAGDAPVWLKVWILLVPMAGLFAIRFLRRALSDRRPAAVS